MKAWPGIKFSFLKLEHLFALSSLQMMVEQKKLKRQSEILMQSSSPTQALQDALSQVIKLTEDLEKQKLEHQSQVCLHYLLN